MYIEELSKNMTVEQILIYLRKSRADNPHETVEEVLSKHEGDLQEAAIRIFGKKIPDENIFREVVSGETISDRPEMIKVLSGIENPNIKAVMVYDVQRLSRGDWEDGGKILTAFKYSKTLVITPSKVFDLNEPSGYDYKTFKMELSAGNEFLEYQKAILRRGIERSMEKGNYLGSVPPYGYRKIIIDGDHTLEPNPEEVSGVEMLFNLYADGMGIYKIKLAMDASPYKPRQGEVWSEASIRRMLQSPVYIGKIRWNYRIGKKVYEDGEIKKIRPLGTDDEVRIVEGKHPAIISEELFNRVQARFGTHTKEKANTELRNPLASLLKCQCGCSMVLRTYRRKEDKNSEFREKRITCRYQVNCKTKSSNFSVVYQRVIEGLEQYVEAFKIKLEEQDDNIIDMQEQMIAGFERELERLNKKQEDLYDFLEDGIYTKDVFLKRNDKIKQQMKDVKEKLKNAKENVPKRINYEDKIIEFNTVIDTLKDDGVSPKHKNELLKEIVEKIVYSSDAQPHKSNPEAFTLKIYLKNE